VAWSVEVTGEFGQWWKGLDQSAQDAVAATIGLLKERGPDLPFRPLRVLYAFDPHRVAILLLGDDKGGSKRWYRKSVARAEDLFDRHLRDLKGGA